MDEEEDEKEDKAKLPIKLCTVGLQTSDQKPDVTDVKNHHFEEVTTEELMKTCSLTNGSIEHLVGEKAYGKPTTMTIAQVPSPSITQTTIRSQGRLNYIYDRQLIHNLSMTLCNIEQIVVDDVSGDETDDRPDE
jgi:hypothetical protein